MPPRPCSSPAYQFCTVEYFTVALSSATSSTTAACSWFSERFGDGHPGEQLLLVERDAELVVRLLDLRVELVQAPERLRRLRRRVVGDRLVVGRLVLHVRPVRLAHRLPAAERLEAPLEQPRRLVLLRGDEADRLLAQPRRDGVGLDLGDEAV